MNVEKLREAEARFLLQYPGGFAHPDIVAISKKHRLEKMHGLAQASFANQQFADIEAVVVAVSRIVSQSSLISVFEKPKFRELVNALSSREREQLADGLQAFLHGDQERGFAQMVSLLAEYKLAKWPLLTVCPTYYHPNYEVFIKPTTAKRVIEYFQLADLVYSPRPTFAFYQAYRQQINQMKALLGAELPADNAAFCGFLMMAVEDEQS